MANVVSQPLPAGQVAGVTDRPPARQIAAPAQLPLPAVLPNAGQGDALSGALGAAGLGLGGAGWLVQALRKRGISIGESDPVEEIEPDPPATP